MDFFFFYVEQVEMNRYIYIYIHDYTRVYIMGIVKLSRVEATHQFSRTVSINQCTEGFYKILDMAGFLTR